MSIRIAIFLLLSFTFGLQAQVVVYQGVLSGKAEGEGARVRMLKHLYLVVDYDNDQSYLIGVNHQEGSYTTQSFSGSSMIEFGSAANLKDLIGTGTSRLSHGLLQLPNGRLGAHLGVYLERNWDYNESIYAQLTGNLGARPLTVTADGETALVARSFRGSALIFVNDFEAGLLTGTARVSLRFNRRYTFAANELGSVTSAANAIIAELQAKNYFYVYSLVI